jgi:hypothetical protein
MLRFGLILPFRRQGWFGRHFIVHRASSSMIIMMIMMIIIIILLDDDDCDDDVTVTRHAKVER